MYDRMVADSNFGYSIDTQGKGDVMPSKAEIKRRKKRRSAERSREYYSNCVGESRLPQAPQQKTVGLHAIKQEPKILDEDIFKLGDLSSGALTHHKLYLLYAVGIHTVRALTSRSEEDLLAIQGIGVATVIKIRDTIEYHGASLRIP